ncbi:hypothetical protein [Glycocaulis sp.]|uniref:hypothetical protein n=1 Tax=Glycocaulis sp. TaxID=1969725 RepID=UPI003D22C67D
MGPGKKLWLGISARIRVVLMAMLAVAAMKLGGNLASSGDGAAAGADTGARISLDRSVL